MATLNVKDFPDDLYGVLRERARENGRSIRGEVLHLLGTELLHRRRTAVEALAEIRLLRERFRPLTSGPDVQDLLREDRER